MDPSEVRPLLKKKTAFWGIFWFVFGLFLPGCFPQSSSQVESLTLAGSTSVQPFAEKLAEIYMEINSNKVIINVQGGGSTAGIKACQEKAAQIGTCSRELRSDEGNLKRIIIAWDGIAIIVHPANPVRNMTTEQLRDIFSGKDRDLGWPGVAAQADLLCYPGGRIRHPGRLRASGHEKNPHIR